MFCVVEKNRDASAFIVKLYNDKMEYYVKITTMVSLDNNAQIFQSYTQALANAFHIAAINNCGIIDKTRKA